MDSPIPHVEDVYFYSRENNILIANKTNGEKVPLVEFQYNFPDLVVVVDAPLNYMKKFMTMYPNLWEKVEPEKTDTNPQLSLF
jgi:hypothetical protein